MFRYLLAFCILLPACASLKPTRRVESFKIKELESSVADIRAVISSVAPIGIRNVSGNGRELYSKHFQLADQNRYRPATDAVERYYVKFIVLGDRRPYDLEIIVAHEKRVLRGDSFVYVIDYYDNVLARDLAHAIQDELAKRREDRNIIDDFRVF